jgi:transcriptional regulator with XRE-family HTH domain
MMNTVGQRVYNFRKKRGMTRKELAEDVCDESTLLRIEKDQQEPRLNTVHLLCVKLDIPIDYLINYFSHKDLKYINRVKRLCREYVYHQDYLALQQLIEEVYQDKEAHFFNTGEFKKFINWHEAILTDKKEGNLIRAEHKLKQLLPKNYQFISEADIGIANSLGLIYLSLDKQDKALELFKIALISIDLLSSFEDKTLFVRVSYNYAFALFHQGRYDEVINIALQTIYYIDSNHLKYMAGRLNHILAIAYEKMNILDEAEKHMTKAAQLFLAESRNFYHAKALRALSEIQFKAGKKLEGIKTLDSVEELISTLSDSQDIPKLVEKMKKVYVV